MIGLSDVESARVQIAPHIRRTPMVSSDTISRELGVATSLKLELLQKTGSFKPRGAVAQVMARGDIAHGIVGYSGGNFAQGAAYAGKVLGVRTLILMPETTPQNYVDATRGYGADVELTPTIGDAVKRAQAHADAGWTLVHPFDDPAMMAGNGSVGLEIMEDLADVTDVVVSIGGGGFIGGVAAALKGINPGIRMWGVETEGADTMSRTLAAGELITIQPTSIAKTLGAPWVSESTVELAERHLEDIVVVSDRDAVSALVFLAERAKVLTEPAASATLAAARRIAGRLGGDARLCLVLCGGNVALADVASWRQTFSV